jgi:hypothetical protein
MDWQCTNKFITLVIKVLGSNSDGLNMVLAVMRAVRGTS